MKPKKKRKTQGERSGGIESSNSMKRSKRAQRKLDAEYFLDTSIKATLNSIIKYQPAKDALVEGGEELSKLFYHTCLAILMKTTEEEGKLVKQKGKVVTTKDELHSMWGGMARAMWRCVTKQGPDEGRGGNADEGFYQHCKWYCDEFDPQGFKVKDSLGWKGDSLQQKALQIATNHANHLDGNLPGFAVRFVRALAGSEEEYSAINSLTRGDFNRIISAVSYGGGVGDDQLAESVEKIIARRPTTFAGYNNAVKEMEIAEKKLKTNADRKTKAQQTKHAAAEKARDRAQKRIDQLLRPGHPALLQAEGLRVEFRKLCRSTDSLSEKSERMFKILKLVCPYGQSLQQLAKEAAAARRASGGGKRGGKRGGRAGDDSDGSGPGFRMKGKWAFALCPLVDYGPQYVLLLTHAAADSPPTLSHSDFGYSRRRRLSHSARPPARSMSVGSCL